MGWKPPHAAFAKPIQTFLPTGSSVSARIRFSLTQFRSAKQQGLCFHASGSIRNLVPRHSSLVTRLPIRAIPAEHLLELRDLNGKNRRKIFSFLRRHRALVRDNISIFVANTAQWFHAKKFENSVQRFLLAIAKIFELHDSDLFSRKKLEDAFELFGIKTAIDIGKAPRFDRQRLRDPPRLFFERIQKIERLPVFEALHVPVSECAIDRISQQDDEFD